MTIKESNLSEAVPPMVDDLKSQLRKAEVTSEKYQTQLLTLQSRLDEALGGQARLEQTASAHAEKIESLQNNHKEVAKQKKQLQDSRDESSTTSLRDGEGAAAAREEELSVIISRLQDTLAQREPRKSMDGHGRMSRTSTFWSINSFQTGC